jgi:H+/Cl- antiporter ClcA
MEELHQRISPLLFSVAAISVVVSQITAKFLAMLGFPNDPLFHVDNLSAFPVSRLFLVIILGAVCGVFSILFAKIYHKADRLVRVKLSKLSVMIKVPVIFASVAVIGFFITDIMGSGHSLIEKTFERELVWVSLIIIFLVRLVFMMISNTAGVTGGIFLPTLSFGAIIGALCAELFIATGMVGDEHYLLFIILGITAFLGANSRIPITACIFAIEVLNGAGNIFPIIIATTAAFLVVELSGIKDFTDTVVDIKKHAFHKGKEPYIVEVPLTVYDNSFVVGKELRDILWPAACVVVYVEQLTKGSDKLTIAAGDIIYVHYKTYYPIDTANEVDVLVGKQSKDIEDIMRNAYEIPEK